MRRVVRATDQIQAKLQWAGDALRRGLEGGKPVVLEVKRETRKLELNAVMWVKLTDIANQVELNGKKYDKDRWKLILLTAHRNEQQRSLEWIVGIDGRPVELGGTSAMPNEEILDFIAYIEAYGSEHGVRWSAPKRYE